jgi:hypothetical protein
MCLWAKRCVCEFSAKGTTFRTKNVTQKAKYRSNSHLFFSGSQQIGDIFSVSDLTQFPKKNDMLIG